APPPLPAIPDPVQADRDDSRLHIQFNRPQRHNAFSTDMRAALLEALEVARLDPSITEVVLTGNGPSFCSGGDLAEFGTLADPASARLARTRSPPPTAPWFCSAGDLAEFGPFADPASAHLARTRYSPALVLDELTARLGRNCRAEVHGQVLGSGLEMAAYCGWVQAHPDAVLGLPELSLGLIPGAG